MTSDYGLKVSNVGYDIKTTGIANQTFNSEKNCIKLTTPGTASHAVAGYGNYTFEIAHPFDFIPAFLVFSEWESSGDWSLIEDNWYLEAYMASSSEAYSDVNNLYVKVYNNEASSKTCKIFYIIFADEAS